MNLQASNDGGFRARSEFFLRILYYCLADSSPAAGKFAKAVLAAKRLAKTNLFFVPFAHSCGPRL